MLLWEGPHAQVSKLSVTDTKESWRTDREVTTKEEFTRLFEDCKVHAKSLREQFFFR